MIKLQHEQQSDARGWSLEERVVPNHGAAGGLGKATVTGLGQCGADCMAWISPASILQAGLSSPNAIRTLLPIYFPRGTSRNPYVGYQFAAPLDQFPIQNGSVFELDAGWALRHAEDGVFGFD